MEVHRQLRTPDRAVGLGPNKILSVPDAIGIALHDWFQDKQGVQQELIKSTPAGGPPAKEQITSPKPVTVAGGVQMEMAALEDQMAKSFIGTCPDCGSQLEFIRPSPSSFATARPSTGHDQQANWKIDHKRPFYASVCSPTYASRDASTRRRCARSSLDRATRDATFWTGE
jgi:hypothetical protein